MKITGVTSEVFEWERPGIWNGGHFYGPGRLHKVTVTTDEGIIGYGWNGGTAAERPLALFPLYVDYFRPLLIGRDPAGHTGRRHRPGREAHQDSGSGGSQHAGHCAAINIACWDIKGKGPGTVSASALGRRSAAHPNLHRGRLATPRAKGWRSLRTKCVSTSRSCTPGR